jgi:hypothetical protein
MYVKVVERNGGVMYQYLHEAIYEIIPVGYSVSWPGMKGEFPEKSVGN